MSHLELAEDLKCFQCGYNLRGLAPDGKCPECGKEIQITLNWQNLSRKPIPVLMIPRLYLIVSVVFWISFLCNGFEVGVGVVLGFIYILPTALIIGSAFILHFFPRSVRVHDIRHLFFGIIILGILNLGLISTLLIFVDIP